MSQSYYGSVEVGPHWCGDVLFESVAEREKLAGEVIAHSQKSSAIRAQVMRDNPGLDLDEEPSLATVTAIAEENRRDALRSHERAAEIWEEILPATGQIMALLHALPADRRLWALAQVVGDTVSQMSETKKDAIVRHQYLDDCTCQKIGEVFGRRESKGAMRVA